MRRKVVVGEEEFEILDVDYVSQKPHMMYCFVAALKMSWDFIREHYGGGGSDDRAPSISFERIATLTRVDELTGVQLNQEFLNGFNGEQQLVDARLVFPITMDSMQRRIDKGLPVIACYYPSLCEHPGAEAAGAGHACVYLGKGAKKVHIHNPWHGPFHRWPDTTFDQSRIPMQRAAIVFERRTSLMSPALVQGEEE